jgi:hypothetical protein
MTVVEPWNHGRCVIEVGGRIYQVRQLKVATSGRLWFQATTPAGQVVALEYSLERLQKALARAP